MVETPLIKHRSLSSPSCWGICRACRPERSGKDAACLPRADAKGQLPPVYLGNLRHLQPLQERAGCLRGPCAPSARREMLKGPRGWLLPLRPASANEDGRTSVGLSATAQETPRSVPTDRRGQSLDCYCCSQLLGQRDGLRAVRGSGASGPRQPGFREALSAALRSLRLCCGHELVPRGPSHLYMSRIRTRFPASCKSEKDGTRQDGKVSEKVTLKPLKSMKLEKKSKRLHQCSSEARY
ncbi:uncharacterized protein LOC123937254 [Meles meles]|uniref:uncharacterized protein LOC123937254 n=1 Tax=Meles meles TaxID=9662 RepID=UPI001E69DA2B|nr:uncharacterized protein LOC123937254 [Meles meles]XP_045853926.1 uncharacterized protein LOC123937254 [Meles meles]XP_045853927.1 uncharacterized protein LOC123937254 [Meles meles]